MFSTLLKVNFFLILFLSDSMAQKNEEIIKSIEELKELPIGSFNNTNFKPIDLNIWLTNSRIGSRDIEIKPIIDLEFYNSSSKYRHFITENFKEGLLIFQNDRFRPILGALPNIGSQNILESDREMLELCRTALGKFDICRNNGECGNSDLMSGAYCTLSPTNIKNKIGWGKDKSYFQSKLILENSIAIITDKPICSGLLIPSKVNHHSHLLTALHCNTNIRECQKSDQCTPKAFRLSDYNSASITNLKYYDDNLDLAVYELEEKLDSTKIEFAKKLPFPSPATIAGSGRVSPYSFSNTEIISQKDIAKSTSMVSAPYTLCQIKCEGNNRLYHSCQTTESTSGAPIFIKDNQNIKIIGLHLSSLPGGECGEHVQESLPGFVIAKFLNEVGL